MRKPFAQLRCVENREAITEENQYAFLHQLQLAILLTLRERGSLTMMQYHYALEGLNRRRRNRAARLLRESQT